jgi:ionotropic glutamate receptor
VIRFTFKYFSFNFSFEAERKTCELLEMGVAAVFGPQNSATADHIRSITDVAEIPFIDTRLVRFD